MCSKLAMFSVLFILLSFSYLTMAAYSSKASGKRICDEASRHLDEYSTINDRMQIRKRRSLPLDPDALFLTPYIENGLIEEAILNSRVEEPFSSYESYSGFLTVNNATNANLFMWFFPCLQEDVNASLVVWLESGHKYPSSSRVFDTAGPYSRADGRIHTNENTLLDNFHVLYIDTPVGSGFSFTDNPDGYSTTFDDAGRDVAEALRQFTQIFNDTVQNGVYLNCGDTYTSKIAVHSTWHLHREGNSTSGIRIEGLMIGNGLLDPINMIGASDLLYQIGVADQSTRQHLRSLEEEIKRLLRSHRQWDAYEKYQDMVSEIHRLGYERIDDFTTTVVDDSDDSQISNIFSRRRIKQALHVGHFRYNDIDVSSCYLQQDMFTSVAIIISKLIPHTKFLFYIGQYGIEVRFFVLFCYN